MSTPIEQIEIKIAYLEQANAELSEVVYRQGQELESLLNGTTPDRGGSAASPAAPAVVAPKTPLPTAKKTPTKKR